MIRKVRLAEARVASSLSLARAEELTAMEEGEEGMRVEKRRAGAKVREEAGPQEQPISQRARKLLSHPKKATSGAPTRSRS